MTPTKEEDFKNKVMEIMKENIHFTPQVDGYVVHGAIDKIWQLAASLNRQGCRWVLDFDFWKSSNYEPVEEGNYQGLYKYKYDVKGSGTFYTAKELLDKYLKATESESIEPCATSSENRKIFLGEMLSIAKEIAVDFYWENNINHIDGYQKFRQEFDSWIKENKYINIKLLSERHQLATDGREELEKEIAYIKDTLDDCREYMDDKADVDVDNDYFVPNKEAKLLSRIDSTIEKLNKHYGRGN